MSNPSIILTLLSLLVGVVTAGLAGAAFVRAGRWRDSDDGKAVKEDIHSIKNEITKINGRLERAERVDEDLPEMTERIARIETTLETVATAGDFREVKAEIAGINRSMNNIQSATTRIETYLRESGK